MAPVFDLGISASVNGSYLSAADIRAFDLIGLNIKESSIVNPVTAATLTSPGPMASIDPTSDLTLSWSAVTGATNYHAFIDRILPGDERERVFEAFDLPTGTTTTVVPANTLFAGRDYEWSVTAENWRGYAYADFVPFDTGDCIADVNNDGVVSPADFSAWITAYNSASPGCDQNGDGLCTPADFSAWVTNYNAGCD